MGASNNQMGWDSKGRSDASCINLIASEHPSSMNESNSWDKREYLVSYVQVCLVL